MNVSHVQFRNNKAIVAFDSQERLIETLSKWSISMLSGARKRSYKTVERYLRNIGYFVDWLAKHEVYRALSVDDALTTVTQGGVKEYLAELEVDGLASNTIRNRDVTIKVFMDWLTTKEAGQVRETSTHDDKLLSPTPKSKVPKYINEDQMIQFLLGFHNEYQRCMAHLMYDVGYRRSELVWARWKDFHEIDGWPNELGYAPITVRSAKKEGGRISERISIISRPMLNRVLRYHNSLEYRRHMQKWSDEERPAFLNVHGEAISYGAIGNALEQASERAGIYVHPHALRHGCAYNIMRSEHGRSLMDNLVLVKKQFGHARVTSSEIYTQIPAILLSRLGLNENEKTWYERADKIYKNTFLPAKLHKEKRGHSKYSKG